MPVYDFYCPGCNRKYELLVKSPTSSPTCPDCQGRLEKQLSAPTIQTKSKSGSSRDSAVRITIQDFPDGSRGIKYVDPVNVNVARGRVTPEGGVDLFGIIKTTDNETEGDRIEETKKRVEEALK